MTISNTLIYGPYKPASHTLEERCPSCLNDITEMTAIAHSDGGELHAQDILCVKAWLNAQEERGEQPTCGVCRRPIDAKSVRLFSKEEIVRLKKEFADKLANPSAEERAALNEQLAILQHIATPPAPEELPNALAGSWFQSYLFSNAVTCALTALAVMSVRERLSEGTFLPSHYPLTDDRNANAQFYKICGLVTAIPLFTSAIVNMVDRVLPNNQALRGNVRPITWSHVHDLSLMAVTTFTLATLAAGFCSTQESNLFVFGANLMAGSSIGYWADKVRRR
jgi:hypothetical protein